MTSFPPSKNSSNQDNHDSQDRPVLLFTNFWDANAIVSNGYCIVSDNSTYHKVNFIPKTSNCDADSDSSIYLDTPENFKFVSIALQSPSLSKMPTISEHGMETQHALCPTYEILMEYKATKDWDKFSQKYMELIATRRQAIRKWIDSLENKVYLCCCWENTCGKAKCHRSLLFEAFKKSKYVREKVVLLHRDGSFIESEIDNGPVVCELPTISANNLPNPLVFRLSEAGLTETFNPEVESSSIRLTMPQGPIINRLRAEDEYEPFDLW